MNLWLVPSTSSHYDLDHSLSRQECLVNDRTRPLLLITDRISDLFPVLQHASTYQVTQLLQDD
jgi:hypothetical protein